MLCSFCYLFASSHSICFIHHFHIYASHQPNIYCWCSSGTEKGSRVFLKFHLAYFVKTSIWQAIALIEPSRIHIYIWRSMDIRAARNKKKYNWNKCNHNFERMRPIFIFSITHSLVCAWIGFFFFKTKILLTFFDGIFLSRK